MLAGLGSMAVAVFNRRFYWLKGWFAGDKPAPLWVGRVLFGTIGILFFFAGAYSLFR
jgi:hypothetical protein